MVVGLPKNEEKNKEKKNKCQYFHGKMIELGQRWVVYKTTDIST